MHFFLFNSFFRFNSFFLKELYVTWQNNAAADVFGMKSVNFSLSSMRASVLMENIELHIPHTSSERTGTLNLAKFTF